MRLEFNKKSLRVILASSCIATLLGVGYTKAKSENFLYSYCLTDNILNSQYKKANRLIDQYKVLN